MTEQRPDATYMDAERRDIETEAYKTFMDFKEIHQKSLEEVKKLGHETRESREQLNRVHERLGDLETKWNRPRIAETILEPQNDYQKKHADAFQKYILTGNDYDLKNHIRELQNIQDVEKKQLSLNETIDPDGGYLVPAAYYDQIIRSNIQFSNMRGLARVVQVPGKEFKVPVQERAQDPRTGARRPGMFQSGWTADMGPVTNTEVGQFRMETIYTHDMYALPPITQDVREDNQYALLEYTNEQVGYTFAYDEGEGFTNGNGVGRPFGILTNFPEEQTIYSGNPNGFPAFNAGTGNSSAGNLFSKMFFYVPDVYAKNGTFLMNRFTIQQATEFVDANGQYLWSREFGNTLANSSPFSFRGRPYQEMINFPAPDEAGNFEEGDTMCLFGDIYRAYMIVDRTKITVMEDPYTQKPNILLYYRKRVGGQRILSEAVVRLVAGGDEG